MATRSIGGMFGTPAGLPGARFSDPRVSMAQRLMLGAADTSPVQHWSQGLGRMAQALLGVVMERKAEQDQRDASQALVKGISAQPWTNPDTGQQQGTAGGLQGAMAALGGIDKGNPYAAGMMSDLAMQQHGQDQALRMLGLQRAMDRQDADTKFGRDKELTAWKAQKDAEFRAPKYGTEVPYPPAVAEQLAAIAGAKAGAAAEAGRDPTSVALHQAQLDKLNRERVDTERQQADVAASLDRTMRTANELLNHPGREWGTGASSWTSRIPGTPAKDFAAMLESFKAQNFLPAVQQLKGMGQLSNAEGAKLEAAVGALDPAMSEEAFKASLQAIIRDLEAARSRAPGSVAPQPRGQATPDTRTGGQVGLTQAEQAELDALRKRFGR